MRRMDVQFKEADIFTRIKMQILDVTLADADGQLNPDENRPGFIVSDHANLIGGDCTALVDSCKKIQSSSTDLSPVSSGSSGSSSSSAVACSQLVVGCINEFYCP